MEEAEILAKAMEAQKAHGVDAVVQVFLPRVPNGRQARYVQQLRLRPKQGPWGRIVALAPNGTHVEFKALKVIAFFSALQAPPASQPRKLTPRTAERVQVHPVLSRSNIERITELCAARNITLSAIMDHALGEYIERYA